MTSLWNRARERFFQTDLKIWSDRAASGAGENIGSTAWNMEEDDQYEYASNCGVVWTPASTTPSEIAFIPTVTLGSVEDTLFTRGATLAMDWDPEGTPLSASYNTKRVGVTGIQSVTWESSGDGWGIMYTGNPLANGGGYRVFPEADWDSEKKKIGASNDKVGICVTLSNAIPTGMEGNVYLNILDPMNQCSAAWDGVSTENILATGYRVGDLLTYQNTRADNHGYAALVNTYLTVDSTSTTYETKLILSQHPGDNYIVAVHPNLETLAYVEIQTTGTPDYKTPVLKLPNTAAVNYNDSLHTPLLTVWRSLWVEKDYMVLNGVTYEPVDLDLVTSEFSRACVWVREFPGSANSISGIESFPLQDTEERTAWSETLKENRALPLSTQDFWCIYTVGCIKMGTNYGVRISNNIAQYVLAFNKFTEDQVNNYPSVDLEDAKEVVMLHEFVHTFDYETLGGNEHDTVGLMNSTLDLNKISNTAYKTLSVAHIRAIQSCYFPY